MPKSGPGLFVSLFLLLAAGCAPTVPAAFQSAESPTLKGPVLAMAEAGGVVVAATPAGLFRRQPGGPWACVESPGLRRANKVTALALLGDELFVATRGDGLYIQSGGTWEVLNSRYGGLTDDRVLCLAVDQDGRAPFGIDVWAGTAKGLTVRRNGKWEAFRPGKGWLWDLVGASIPREGKTYVTAGFALGDSSERGGFLPPVRAIGLGRGRVVLGGDSRLAILDEGVYAAVHIDGGYEVTSLLVEDSVLWAGTSGGLLWGGPIGVAERLPYPAWRPSLGAQGVLFGSRDTRPYHFIWRQFGFNSARVRALARDGQAALWVAYNAAGWGGGAESSLGGSAETIEPTTSLRRYGNLEEYLESGDRPHYEVYGKNQGFHGNPTALLFSKAEEGIMAGSSEGFVLLK